MPELFYINPAPSSDSIGEQPAGSTVANSTPYSAPRESSDATLSSRVESLEKLIDDLRTNSARRDKDESFNNLTVKDKIIANFGKIGGWLMNAGVLSTDKMIIDSNNSNIRSSNYQTGTSGFKISSDLVEAENLIARGTLRGATFSYDIINAIGGQLLVANADTIAEDMQPLDAATMKVKGDTTFAVNDILVIRGVATSGVQEEWLRVTAVSGNTLSVTRDLASQFTANTNPTWRAGTPVVKQGSSDGASTYSGGWLKLLGEGTNSPYYAVFSRTGVAYNAYTEVARFGNLNGFLNYATDLYGIAIGDSAGYMTYDTTNGLRISGTLFGDGSDGDVTISVDTTLASDKFYNNLTINSGKVLNPGGFRIFVKNTLTNNGTIRRNGTAGGDGGNGAASTAGTAGVGAAKLADGNLYGGTAGSDGSAGPNAGSAGAGVNGSANTCVGNSGKNGGAGGNGNDRNGGAGGTGGTATAETTKLEQKLSNIASGDSTYTTYLIPIASTNSYLISSSAGAAGGGGGGGRWTSPEHGGGGGGGGGASGAVIFISARFLINNGVIESNGGNGGNGGLGSPSYGGNGGGGAGGNGGTIILLYQSKVDGTITVNGGNGGTVTNTGNGSAVYPVAGTNGDVGKIYKVLVK